MNRRSGISGLGTFESGQSVNWANWGTSTANSVVSGFLTGAVVGAVGEAMNGLAGTAADVFSVCRMPAVPQLAAKFAINVVSGAVTDAAFQGVNILLGNQQEFSVTEMFVAGGLSGVLGAIFQNACWRASSPMMTRGGSIRADQVRRGDRLLAQNEYEPDGPIEEKEVEEVFVAVAGIVEITVAGRVIGTTSSHPVYVAGRGWTNAADLVPGDLLQTHEKRYVEVERVEHTGQVETVFNFRVADHHAYFVGCAVWGFSVWAHNSICGESSTATEAEAAENGLSVVGKNAAVVKAAGEVEHHVFPQALQDFFRNKFKIDVHDFVVVIDDLTHQALHAGQSALNNKLGWWGQELMTRISAAQALEGPLSSGQVVDIARGLLARFKLGNLPFQRYSRAPQRFPMDLKDMWTLDLDRASQALGFSSVVDHIAQKPSIGYGAIAEELGPGIAPIQVVRAYLVGARKQGELRSAIFEHLRRCILEELPSGWGVGHDSSWKATKAISGWISEVVVSGDNATLQSRLLEIGKRIKGNPPPEGWAPVTPHDELLASYFEGFDV